MLNREQPRVLGRIGARELTPAEIDHVSGGIRTTTLCIVTKEGALNGDTQFGEC